MKDKDLKNLNKVIIATVILLLIVVIFFQAKKQYNEDKDVEVTIETPIVPQAGPTHAPHQKLKVDRKSYTELYKHSIGFNDGRYNYIVSQKLLIKEFQDLIKLDFDLPKNMQFTKLDMEDSVAGLYGVSYDREKSMAVLATEGSVKMSDIIDYLKTSEKALPLMKDHKIVADGIETYPYPENSGMKNLKVIPTLEKNGKTTYAAVMERKDGKGTYVFVMEAPNAYFHREEGSLDLLLESVKVK